MYGIGHEGSITTEASRYPVSSGEVEVLVSGVVGGALVHYLASRRWNNCGVSLPARITMDAPMLSYEIKKT